MDEGFNRADTKIENLRAEMRAEFRSMHRLVFRSGSALIAAVLADTIVGRL